MQQDQCVSEMTEEVLKRFAEVLTLCKSRIRLSAVSY